jgi:hypothetical protein
MRLQLLGLAAVDCMQPTACTCSLHVQQLPSTSSMSGPKACYSSTTRLSYAVNPSRRCCSQSKNPVSSDNGCAVVVVAAAVAAAVASNVLQEASSGM